MEKIYTVESHLSDRFNSLQNYVSFPFFSNYFLFRIIEKAIQMILYELRGFMI